MSIILGLLIIIVVGGYLFIDKYMLFEGSYMLYSSYIIYQNFWYLSSFFIGLGIILLFFKRKKARYGLMILLLAITFVLIYKKNTPKIIADFPLIKTEYYNYLATNFIKRLESEGFSKAYKLDTINSYLYEKNRGKPKNIYEYPYKFYKTDLYTGLELSIYFDCTNYIFNEDNTLNKEKIKNSKVRSIEIYYKINKNQEKDSILKQYKILKSIFYKYKKQFDSYYKEYPYVKYPKYRTFYNHLPIAKGSDVVVNTKNDMIDFIWGNNISSTTLRLDGSKNWEYEDIMKKENTTFFINEENMYVYINKHFTYK